MVNAIAAWILKLTITMAKFRLIFLLLFISPNIFAQQINAGEMIISDSLRMIDTTSKLQVRNILINGNRKTKDYIIMREVHFRGGDSIITSRLNYELELARQQVYNTTLFSEVIVEPVILNSSDIDVHITVKEKWYIYPVPQFNLVDRSFNEWAVKYKGSLSRVNYGLRFVHYNLSGRKDQLKLSLINGYSRNITMSYTAPYSNPKLTSGFSIAAGFAQYREIAYKTSYENNFLRFNNGNFVNQSWFIQASFLLRRAIRQRHRFSISYVRLKILDTIPKVYNTNYYNNSSPKQSIVDLSYVYSYTNVDNILYPTSGKSFSISAQKRGWGFDGGINYTSLGAEYNRYFNLGKNWYTSLHFSGNIKLPFDQPFINQRALGIGDTYLRGLEYFVIDGVAYALGKFNLKKQLLKFYFPTPFKKSKTLNKIPFRIIAKTYADIGYAYNRKELPTRLNNIFLYTGGFGIDIITLYDIQFRLEYSFNQLGQNNLFLHNQSGF
jgi:outer membrane protein assembly factor BamA